ncbi:hypothetical protein [Methylomonas sp. TEB]|uniref:hypothetical protein n=1 Tax=Methylomonas sp. TEB TaxID=3398229 RepID=UPI0039F56A74
MFACTALAEDATIDARIKVGAAFFELGGTASSLVWTAVKGEAALAKYPSDEVFQLATRIQTDLDNTKASSSFGRAVGNAGAATFQLMAATDPEPTSKISFTVAAYATQAAANYLADATYKDVQEKSLGALRKALDDRQNNLTPQKLVKMDKDEFLSGIDGLKLGNKTMRDVFKGNTAALELLKANVSDYLISNSAATLFSVKKLDGDVETVRKTIVSMDANLKKFREESIERFQNIEDKTDAVLESTKSSSEQLAKLRELTQGNLRAIQTLTDISYLGWSTDQKLAAVKAGQFPELDDEAREKLIGSLEADKRREKAIGDLQLVSRDIGSLTTLAGNLGMPPIVVKGLSSANTATSALIKFNSGDVLGAVASLSGLFGGQKSDLGAERHKQLMTYLATQFGEVNKRLERIQKLQEDTLVAITDLSKLMSYFRNEVHQQLSFIENVVLRNDAMLGELIREKWVSCRAMRNASNQLPWFSSRQEILDALGTGDSAVDFRNNWKACNALSFGFLNGNILTGSWAGGIADMRTASGPVTSEKEMQKALISYANLRIAEYQVARDALLAAAPDLFTSPAPYLIRLGQPAPTVSARDALVDALASQRDTIEQFNCNSTNVLNLGQRKLACLGVPSGSTMGPLPNQVEQMFGDTLIGPNGWSLIDSMIAVSRTAAFVRLDGADQYKFLSPEDLDTGSLPNDNLKTTVSERRGLDLLQAMSPMAELNILQQSVAYGDLVPQMVLDILYDDSTRVLRSEVDLQATMDKRSKQDKALNAIRVNPVLARNVLMLAVRKVLTDSNGKFPTTYYGLAIANFMGQSACLKDPVAMSKLNDLFPGWKLEYRLEKSASASGHTATCKEGDEMAARGAGLVLDFGNFYVKMPSAEIASEGIFEYPQSLTIALRYREKIGQELIDRSAFNYFKDDRKKVDFLDVASKLNHTD